MKRMNVNGWMTLLAICLIGPGTVRAAQLGSAFNFQGRLVAGGAPAWGGFDLKLMLFDAAVGGAAVSPSVTNQNVVVSNGLFNTQVDFGPGIFNGITYYLEVAVRPAGSALDFGPPLTPRTPIIGTPYALHAVNAQQLGGQSATSFWSLGGNTGTTPGTDFLGTLDRQPVEFRVGDERAFLLSPSSSVANVIAGPSSNEILGNAVGVSVAGGDNNDVGGDYGHIGGGQNNSISNTGDYGVIPGGRGAGAFNYGQQAFASGSFSAAGDAQTSIYVLRGSTSTASPVSELFLDGVGARMQIPRDSAWAFDILIIGSGADGSAGGFQAKGVVKRVGATTTLINPTTTLFAAPIAMDGGNWSVAINGNDTSDALTVTVTGDTFQEVRWVATIRTAELVY